MTIIQSRLNFDALCIEIEKRMRALRIPGVSIGVVHEGQALFAGFGITSLDNPLAVTPATLFQCGSITKTVVATALMRLEEQGLLSLDAPVRAVLPDLKLRDPDVAERVTLRHLLTHTSGWLGDYFNDFGFGDDANARLVAEMATLPQWTPLGQIWSYNNIGFALAGRVAEVVTGKPIETVLREQVLDPLKMTQTVFFPTEVMTRRFATGHNINGNGVTTATPWEIGRANHAAGGLTTTVLDLIRYAQCHIADGRTPDGQQLISRPSARAMRQPFIKATSRYDMGLTWWLGTLGREKEQFIHHGGATNGFMAHLRIVPGRRFAIAILTNSDNGSQLHEPISQLALQAWLGLSLDKVRPQRVGRAQLGEYAGHYTAPLTKRQLSIIEGSLQISTTDLGGFPTPSSPVHGQAVTGPDTLAFYARDKAFVASDPILGARGEFIRDTHGRVAWLRWGGRLHKRAE